MTTEPRPLLEFGPPAAGDRQKRGLHTMPKVST